ncbi:hypothetical protein I312_105493 [Cryptococcus bacillisporus CA1280]|uniref:uncharacterized protein n=1 Tax=Cryptococcus bacillisporus CA1280 TaxID=1296109 RepID=UPI00336952C4
MGIRHRPPAIPIKCDIELIEPDGVKLRIYASSVSQIVTEPGRKGNEGGAALNLRWSIHVSNGDLIEERIRGRDEKMDKGVWIGRRRAAGC